MWRWTTRILIGLCAGLIVAVCSGATYQWISTRKELAETPPPGRLVDVGGHRLHIWCTGGGEPSVILETGLGGSTVGWGFVQPEVAGFTRGLLVRPGWARLQRSGTVAPHASAHGARA